MMHSFLGLFDCLVVVDALLELLNTVDLRTLLETNKQILCAVKSLRSHSSLVRGIRYINRFSLSSPHESVEWIDYIFSRSGHTLHHILSSPSLYLRFDTNKGWCVMSASTILSRSHILVYNGELISSSTVRQLQSMAEPKPMNYILTVKEVSPPGSEANFVLTTNIDATYCGSLARFANHSCDPNTHISIIREPKSSIIGAPVLVAIRTIAPGEEITFDYGASQAPESEDMQQLKRIKRSADDGTPDLDVFTELSLLTYPASACCWHALTATRPRK